MNKVIVFEIWGRYGMFRKYFTTSSPLSYSFPPRTTIMGIIAAMFGFDRDSYYEKLSSKQGGIAVEILNPIKKTKFSTNYVDTKIQKNGLIEGRTQIRCEYVKNPKYRVYVHFKDSVLQDKLKNILQNKEFYYTISLGIAQHLANIRFLGEFNLQQISPVTDVTLHSVVRMDQIKKLRLTYVDKNFPEYHKDRMLVDFEDDKRSPKEYQDYLYERNGERGSGIFCEVETYFQVTGKNFIKNIIFL